MKEQIHIGQNTIILLGTVHASQESVELVRTTITEVRPDHVAVELDPARLKALESGSAPKGSLRELLRMGIRGTIINLLISYSNRKKAKKVGVTLMSDMLEAVKTAREIKTNLELIDTATPSWDIPFPEFVRLVFFLIKNSRRGIVTDQESLHKFAEELHRAAPSFSALGERDKVMAQNILRLSGTIVVVTGMGHVENLKKELQIQYNQKNK